MMTALHIVGLLACFSVAFGDALRPSGRGHKQAVPTNTLFNDSGKDPGMNSDPDKEAGVLLTWTKEESLCRDGLVPHRNGELCCIPAYCTTGHSIEACEIDSESDQCRPCPAGTVQTNNVTSFNMDEATCYAESEHGRIPCPLDDTKRSRRNWTYSCLLRCECKNEDCFFGDDPCMCNLAWETCGVNQQMNRTTGVCELCDWHSYKPYVGCGPCILNVTLCRFGRQGQKPVTYTSTSLHNTNTTPAAVVSKTEPVELELDVKSLVPKEGSVPTGIIVIIVGFVLVIGSVPFIDFFLRKHCWTPGSYSHVVTELSSSPTTPVANPVLHAGPQFPRNIDDEMGSRVEETRQNSSPATGQNSLCNGHTGGNSVPDYQHYIDAPVANPVLHAVPQFPRNIDDEMGSRVEETRQNSSPATGQNSLRNGHTGGNSVPDYQHYIDAPVANPVLHAGPQFPRNIDDEMGSRVEETRQNSSPATGQNSLCNGHTGGNSVPDYQHYIDESKPVQRVSPMPREVNRPPNFAEPSPVVRSEFQNQAQNYEDSLRSDSYPFLHIANESSGISNYCSNLLLLNSPDSRITGLTIDGGSTRGVPSFSRAGTDWSPFSNDTQPSSDVCLTEKNSDFSLDETGLKSVIPSDVLVDGRLSVSNDEDKNITGADFVPKVNTDATDALYESDKKINPEDVASGELENSIQKKLDSKINVEESIEMKPQSNNTINLEEAAVNCHDNRTICRERNASVGAGDGHDIIVDLEHDGVGMEEEGRGMDDVDGDVDNTNSCKDKDSFS